jgi:hypothetical protein
VSGRAPVPSGRSWRRWATAACPAAPYMTADIFNDKHSRRAARL